MSEILVGGAIAAGALYYLSTQKKVPPPPPNLASLMLTATTSTAITKGGSVGFTMTAIDNNGNNMPNITAAILQNSSTTTNQTTGSNGSVSFSVSFPNIGTYSMLAQAGSISSSVVTVTVSSIPPPNLASLTLIATGSASILTGGSVPFTLTAVDSSGNLMSGVTIPILQNNASLETVTTGSNGLVNFSITFNAVGNFVIQAASGSVSSATVAVTVSSPPSLATIVLSSTATTVPVGGSITFNGIAEDQNGTPIAANGTFNENGSSIGTWTATAGTFTVSVSFPNTGTVAITASSGSVTSNTITITVTPASPVLTNVTLAATTSTTITVGQTVSFSGTVTDQNGNGFGGATITPIINGTALSQTLTSAANGTFSGSLPFNIAGSFSVQASAASGTVTVTSNTVTVTVSATVETITLSASPSSGSVGFRSTFTATVSGIAAVGGIVLTLYEDAATGTGVGTATTNANGVATSTATFSNAGIHTFYAEDVSNGIKSNTISVTVNASTVNTITLIATSPVSISAGQRISFSATVQSSTGTLVNADPVTMFEDAATGVGISTQNTNTSGIALFTLTFPNAGNHTLYVTDPSGGKSGTVAVSVAGVSTTNTITLTATSATVITVGGRVSVQATVTNPAGLPVASDVLTAYVDNGSSGGNGTFTTNSNGIVTASPVFSTIGTHVYWLTDSTGATSNTLTIVVNPAAPPSLASATITTNTTQLSAGGTAIFGGLAQDTTGAAFAGASIVEYEGGTAITGGTTTSSSTGAFSFTLAFPIAGTFLINVTATSGSITVTSNTTTITVNPVGATAITLSASASNVAAGTAVTFTALDIADGSPVAGEVLTFYSGLGTGSGIGTGTTNSAGIATGTLKLNTVGTHTYFVQNAAGLQSNIVTIVVA